MLRRTERLFRLPQAGKNRGLSSRLQGPKQQRWTTKANWTTGLGPRLGAKGARTGRTRLGAKGMRRMAVGTRKRARKTRRVRAVRGVAAVIRVVVMAMVQVAAVAVVPAVPRGVGAADLVAVVVVRVHQVAAVARRVPRAVTAVCPKEVENSTRRSFSASASWTSARGMRAVAT